MSITTSSATDYVQGAKVNLDVAITNSDTGLASDPASLTCRIEDPSGHITDQTLNAGLTRLGTGQYRAIMDTTAASGPSGRTSRIADGGSSIVQDEVDVIPAMPGPEPGTRHDPRLLEKISGDFLLKRSGRRRSRCAPASPEARLPKTFTKPWSSRHPRSSATNRHPGNLRVEHLVRLPAPVRRVRRCRDRQRAGAGASTHRPHRTWRPDRHAGPDARRRGDQRRRSSQPRAPARPRLRPTQGASRAHR